MDSNNKLALIAAIVLVFVFVAIAWKGPRGRRKNASRIFLVWSGLLTLSAMLITGAILDPDRYNSSRSGNRELVEKLQNEFAVPFVLFLFAVGAAWLCWAFWPDGDA